MTDRATECPPRDSLYLAKRWLGHQEHLALIEAEADRFYPFCHPVLARLTRHR